MAKQQLVQVAPPKAPKVPNAKKMGAVAQKKAQQRAKKLIKLGIILAIAAVVVFVVYLVKHLGDQPDKVVNQMIEYARANNQQGFKNLFTQDSIDMLESSWADIYSDGSWKEMMGVLSSRPKLKAGRPNIIEKSGLKFADVPIDLGDEQQTIHLRQEDQRWKVTVCVPLNPQALTLPAPPPPEIVELFELEEEDATDWWKESAEEAAEATEKDNKLAKKAKSKVKVKKPKFKLPKIIK